MWGSLGDYVTSVANSPCSPNGASSHAKLKQTYWLRRCEWGVLLGGETPLGPSLQQPPDLPVDCWTRFRVRAGEVKPERR
jgi:hypothetical protein